MNSADPGESVVATMPGCVMMLGSVLITCVLMFLNGAAVLALLNIFLDESGPVDGAVQGARQFIVLIAPVLLVVIQWIMIDYVRTRLTRDVWPERDID